MQIISNSVDETINIGRQISGYLKAGDILCLFGELGSGKTVLAKGIAWGLGLKKDKIVSPSFVLIREYRQSKLPLYHFDLYRLKSPQEVTSLGYEEYFYNQAVTIIEWADKLGYLIPRDSLKIELLVKGNSQRVLKFKACGRRAKELLDKIITTFSIHKSINKR
ncbi:MAG: tRNA (adenosine(37)-N6)-threonylcarbamoyltransferase complex ATPase subunit type 1 TsaE [Candidatus Omnitrophica bacterium]|nr:tRNA (adenosine(37)-N6)-threonylcarbamoyltransferase complex ATPase subunit type 1 TsaE [Candidatus Omnitrophota bacterium]